MYREALLAPFLSDPWPAARYCRHGFFIFKKIEGMYCILKNIKLTLSIK